MKLTLWNWIIQEAKDYDVEEIKKFPTKIKWRFRRRFNEDSDENSMNIPKMPTNVGLNKVDNWKKSEIKQRLHLIR